jgi:hypothetical protein
LPHFVLFTARKMSPSSFDAVDDLARRSHKRLYSVADAAPAEPTFAPLISIGKKIGSGNDPQAAAQQQAYACAVLDFRPV